MEKVRPPRWTGWPLQTAGDKGYSYPAIREWLERRGIEAMIPQRSDQVGHEGPRRLDRTRYDKLASSFLAFVNLAIIRRYRRRRCRRSRA